jgi:hypothetical protein
MDLCTLAELKAFLGVAAEETADDARYGELIKTASAQIIGYCGRSFEIVAVENELHDGDGTEELRVDLTPIAAVAALSIDGQAESVSELAIYHTMVAFKDSGTYNARLRSTGRVFPIGRQNVSISYLAGYAAVPREIVDMCKLQVVHLMNVGTKQGIVSETNQVAQATTTYSDKALAPFVRATCSRYRRTRMAAV